jgi:hypothetical protein
MKYWKLYFLVILSFGILQSSCNDDEEGCLDTQATNFDVTADIACNSCCTYPTLSFRINHVYDSITNNFVLSGTYLDAIDSPYLVSAIQYYISDVQLVRADGSEVGVTDILDLTFFDNTIASVEDNFSLIKKSIGSYNSVDIGTINTNGNFTKIRFNVGVNNPANYAVIGSMPDEHALSAQTESMHLDITEGYIFNKIQIVKDTTTNDITTYEISGDNNLVSVELDYPISLESGYDLGLIVYLDYKKLFESIDFQNDDDNTIQTKIVTNTANAFSIE